MIDTPSFLLGMLFAFIASAGIVAAIVWWEQRCKRLAVAELHEQIAADERIIAKAYHPPSHNFQREDYSSGQWP